MFILVTSGTVFQMIRMLLKTAISIYLASVIANHHYKPQVLLSTIISEINPAASSYSEVSVGICEALIFHQLLILGSV